MGYPTPRVCSLIILNFRPLKWNYLWHLSPDLLLGKSFVPRQFSSFTRADVVTTNGDEAPGDAEHPDDRSVFAGQLNSLSTAESVRDYFSTFGEVEEVTLIPPRKRSLCSCAFVVFKKVSTLSAVLSQKHIIDLRNALVQRYKKQTFRSRKICIVGVPLHLSELQLKNHFSQFGKVESVEFGFDRDAKCRTSYCFVGFTSENAVVKALRFPKQVVDQNHLAIKKSFSNLPKNHVKGKVLVQGIPEGATVHMVKEYFCKFGTVSFVDLIFYRGHDGQKDFAFVGFKNDEIVDTVTRDNDLHTIDGKSVIVKRATSYQQNQHRDLKIFLENIPSTTSEQQVKEYFKAFGVMKNLRIIKRWRGKDNFQSGIVQFSKMSEVECVMAKHCHMIDGGKVNLRKMGWTALEKAWLQDS